VDVWVEKYWKDRNLEDDLEDEGLWE